MLRPVKGLRPEEEWARAVVTRALSVPVAQHDDNSQDGMHDLSIVYPNRPPGAMEVTLAADPESIELFGLMQGGAPADIRRACGRVARRARSIRSG